MCQRNNIQKRFAAGTICYKVLYNDRKYGYLSVYQRTSWKLGQIRITGFYNYELSSDIIEEYCNSSGSIGSGFFHAFPTLEEAIRFQKTFWDRPSSLFCKRVVIPNYTIAEMRIPEDVDGFSGVYFDRGECFDSITVPILEFVKIVDQNVSNK